MSRLKKGGAVAAVAVSLIGGFEGLRLSTYRDSVGIPTVCYGETRGIRMGMHFTKPQCDAMLLKRLDEFGDGLERCVPRARTDAAAHGLSPMPNDVYDAFLSLSYNIGTARFCHGSVAHAYNAGDDVGACQAMLRYDRAGRLVLPGLERRRVVEKRLCAEGAAP